MFLTHTVVREKFAMVLK